MNPPPKICQVLLILLGSITFASGALWINPSGGIFNQDSNWSNSVPRETEEALFGTVASYQITWTAPITNAGAVFDSGSVTQTVAPQVWLLTNRYIIASTSNDTATVTHSDGALIVTNNAGTAMLNTGQEGTGKFVLENGLVVADWFLATNKQKSQIILNGGTLTILRGATIRTDRDISVGPLWGRTATLSFLGGKSSITGADKYDYGTITLGRSSGIQDGGKGILNISGSNTVVSITGLDTAVPSIRKGGHHEITITGGARLYTGQSQIGLGSSTNNRVIISERGSCWYNTNGIYFGMHSGFQTMILTNGGCFTNGTISSGFFVDLSDNLLLVTGTNSTFRNIGQVFFASFGARNRLIVQNGGLFVADQMWAGSGINNSNFIVIDNASFLINNSFRLRGSVEMQLTNGVMAANYLEITNPYAVFNFQQGLFSATSVLFSNGQSFVVGKTGPSTLACTGGTHVYSSGLEITLNGALVGTGTIVGNVTNYGQIESGNPAGTLQMSNNLVLTPSANLIFNLGGGPQTNFLKVAGDVVFDGSLRVRLTNGFVPSSTQTFVLMAFGSKSGGFNNSASGSRLLTVDNSGSFLVNYSGANLVVSDFRVADLDGDGLPDEWSYSFFAQSPLAPGSGPNDKFGDKDGDGLSNYDEWIAGTDPTDDGDTLKMKAKIVNSHAVIQFNSVFGRNYDIFSSDDLTTWFKVGNPVFVYSSDGVLSWFDSGEAQRNRYYRLSVSLIN